MGEEERRGRNVVIKYNFKNKQTNNRPPIKYREGSS